MCVFNKFLRSFFGIKYCSKKVVLDTELLFFKINVFLHKILYMIKELHLKPLLETGYYPYCEAV